MRSIKSLGKSMVCSVLEGQVKRLRLRHDITVVAVVGSVGKTSTKAAIAQVLSTTKKVLYQRGNYNDRATVPLVFFNEPLPALWDVFAWLGVFRRNKQQIRQLDYPYDVVVLELGTDAPGQISEFAYTKPDIAVVTALTAEHMEQFKTLDAVAKEELGVLEFSKTALINSDDANPKYLQNIGATVQTYSLQQPTADYFATSQAAPALQGQAVQIQSKKGSQLHVHTSLLGLPGAKVVLAAVAVAKMVGVADEAIIRGIIALPDFQGRLQRLVGIKDSTLIDDTYNASPAAVTAALDVLQTAEAPQRIAVLGSMNEMGSEAESMHRTAGEYCDPAKLQYVVTIGVDANQWLAPAAREKGCAVQECTSPYQAAEFVKSILQPKAAVLLKGSQNGVFAEEAVKPLLQNPADQSKLVRQSPSWLAVKRKQFTDAPR
jgi:UDP-N-acetylmuramoyl-tripeptide--D-alanyl-D-alanine ligase